MGLIVAGIALLLVLGAGGYFGYGLLGGKDKQTVAAVEPPTTAATPAAPATAPPADATAAPAMEQPTPGEAATVAAPEAPVPAAPAETAPENEPAAAESALPGGPPSAAGAASPGAAPAKATRPKAPKVAPARTEMALKAQAAQSGKANALAGPAAPPDRWQLYAEAIEQCQRLDLFSRIGCEQRQRWHYCEGYWGRVPQCPGAPTADRGS